MKKFIKPVLAAVLLAALFLAACGNASPVPAVQPAEESPVPARVQPDYSFSVRRKSTECPADFLPLCASGDSYYGTLTERTGEAIPEDVIREAEKKKVKAENDGRYDIIETSLCRISPEGKFYRLKSYRQPESAGNSDGWTRFSTACGISGITMKNENYLLLLEYCSRSGLSSAAGGTVFEYDTDWFLRTIGGKTGREYEKTEIKNPDGLIFNGADMMLASGGNVLLRADSEDGSYVCMISPEGEITECIPYGGEIYGSFFLNNGFYAVSGERNGTRFVSVPEFQSGTFADYAFLPENTLRVYSGSGIYPFFYDDGIAVCGYIPELGSYEKIFSWAELRTDPTGVLSSVIFGEDNTVKFLSETSGSAVVSVTTATVEAALPDGEDASKIVLLTAAPSAALLDAVNDFNASGRKYYVEIEDCSSSVSPDSPEEDLCRYIVDKMGGRFPDIIDLNGLVWQKLAKAGALEDLYPFLSEDPNLDAGDYFPNVLRLSGLEGKLFTTCSGFFVNTLIGAKNAVGEAPGWTYSDLNDALSKRNGAEAFEAYATSEDVLRRCIETDMSLFLDYETGICRFSSDDFISLLEFAGTFPKSFDLSRHSWDDLADCSDLRCRNGRQLLLNSTLCNMTDLSRAGYEFSDDTVFVGYPTSCGTGNSISISSYGTGGNLAMCSLSGGKQAAWEFLRIFFTEEYQEDCPYIPSCRKVFDTQLENAMKVYYVVDAKGKPVISKKTGLPQERARDTVYLSNYTAVKYYAVTEERAEEIKNLISSAEKAACSDPAAVGIVLACAEEYFTGQATASATAGKIQTLMTEYMKTTPALPAASGAGEEPAAA